MKNRIITIAFFATIATMSGCAGFLDEELRGQLAPDNTYTSSYGFEIGSTGLYSIMRSEYNTYGEKGAFMHQGANGGNAVPYESQQVANDICQTNASSDSQLVPFATLEMKPNTGLVESFWKWGYQLVASANLLLEYSEKNTNWDFPTDKTHYQAEARFFRAYGYRTLIYLYGDVPYVDKILYDFKLDFTRDPKEFVLGKAVEDLEFAVKYLPESPDAVQDGKLTRWAGYHLLSEMYLLSARYNPAEAEDFYEKARDAALKVIDSGYYSLMNARFGKGVGTAGDYFRDMFIEHNQNRKSGNKESIYVIQFEYQSLGGGTNSDDWSRRAWIPNYSTINGFTLADSLGGRGVAQIIPMKWWIGTQGTNATPVASDPTGKGIFDDTDVRNSNYNIKRNWYYNNPKETGTYGMKCSITEETWFTHKSLYPAMTKFFFGKVADNPQLTGSYNDKMKFRLGETYLLLAEAYLGLNDAPNAAAAVNKVRDRAMAPRVDAADMDMDYLLDERIRELSGEENRRFTLLRTGKYLERVKKYNDQIKDIVTENHLLWPIPQSVIDSNRDVPFGQNPGYGS